MDLSLVWSQKLKMKNTLGAFEVKYLNWLPNYILWISPSQD